MVIKRIKKAAIASTLSTSALLLLGTVSPAQAATNDPLSFIEQIVQQIQGAQSYFEEMVLGPVTDSLTNLYGDIGEILPSDVFAALGLPDPQKVTENTREENNEGILDTNQIAWQKALEQSALATTNSILGEDGQTTTKESVEDARNRVEIVQSCDATAQAAVVTQDKVEQLSCSLLQLNANQEKIYGSLEAQKIIAAQNLQQLTAANAQAEADRTAKTLETLNLGYDSLRMTSGAGLF